MSGAYGPIWVVVFFALTLATGCDNTPQSAQKSAANMSAERITAKIEQSNPNAGSIVGRVTFAGVPPIPQKLLVVKDKEVCGKQPHLDPRLKVSKNNGIVNAVVSLDIDVGAEFIFKKTDYLIDQTGCEYRPHVLLLPVNMPVQILNNDGILHNVHTFSNKNRAVNVAQPAFKKKLEMVFSEPEAVSVRCDVHGWMNAWIMVVDHPFHAITDSDGNFIIANVPPGKYSLKCWQELLGEKTLEIKVEKASKTKGDFIFTKAD